MRIRPLKPSDAPLMLEWMHDPAVLTYLRMDGESKTILDAEAFIAKAQNMEHDARFAVVSGTDEYLGTVSLKNIDPAGQSAEFAISLRRGAQGRGYGTYATCAVLEYGFAQRQLKRIWLDVAKEHTAGVACYERAGFRYECTLPQPLELRGQSYTLCRYACTPEQFDFDWRKSFAPFGPHEGRTPHPPLRGGVPDMPPIPGYAFNASGKKVNGKDHDMKLISKTAVIAPSAVIGENVIIHEYVVIYPNSIIHDGVELFDHCVVGKPPRAAGGNARAIQEDLPPAEIGEGSVVSVGAVVYAGSTVGRHTLLGDYSSVREECKLGDYCLLGRFVSINYHTEIGDRTKIMDSTHITGNAVVEEDVFISVLVSTTNDNQATSAYAAERVRGPWIKKGAFVGAGANILPGTVVGEGSLVGAGALVTKDVPDRKVVMGIPARVVRDNI